MAWSWQPSSLETLLKMIASSLLKTSYLLRTRKFHINISNLDSAVYEYSVLVSFNIKVEQGDEALGGLVEVHATLGAVNGDIRGSPSPGSETEARQASQVFPGLAGYEDVLQLSQGSTETQLT